MNRLRLSRSESLLGLTFAAVCFSVLAALLSKGRTLGGAESQVGADQLQYLSWILSASHGVTINSLWSIPGQQGSSFLHPGFGISGLLFRLGVPIVASYQLWKLVAIPLVLLAAIAWTRRFVPGGGPRTAALALVLFGLSPVGAIVGWNTLAGGFRAQIEFSAGEVFAPAWLWGYMMTAIAVALLFVTLLLAERQRHKSSLSLSVGVPVLALLCSWLQPWQGAELLAAVVIADLVRRKTGPPRLLLRRLPLLLAAVTPLIYYRWLSASEGVWSLAAEANNAVPLWSYGVWVAALFPWPPAAFALRKRPADWGEVVLYLIPALMIGEYAAIALSGSGTFPFHAVQGIGFSLGVLAVRGGLAVRPMEWWGKHRVIPICFCVLMCVPGTLHRMNLMRLEIHRSEQPYFLESSEADALRFLKNVQGDGGVLAPIKAGLTVPAHTGRDTWVGELSWTPDFRERVRVAEAFFKGQLGEAEATGLLDRSRATFLYADCGHQSELGPALAGRVAYVRTFGCARVWKLKG